MFSVRRCKRAVHCLNAEVEREVFLMTQSPIRIL